MSNAEYQVDAVVIGAGPGGYHAAIRLGQLGKKVICVDRDEVGGVCLNWGCIPTKALLHVGEVIRHIEHAGSLGLKVPKADFDREGVAKFKNDVVNANVGGVKTLFKANGVEFLVRRGLLHRSQGARRQEERGRNASDHGAKTSLSRQAAAPIDVKSVAARRRNDRQLRRRRAARAHSKEPARDRRRRHRARVRDGLSPPGREGARHRDDAADSHRHRSRDRKDARTHSEEARHRDHARTPKSARSRRRQSGRSDVQRRRNRRKRRDARVRHGSRRRRPSARHRQSRTWRRPVSHTDEVVSSPSTRSCARRCRTSLRSATSPERRCSRTAR